MFTFPPMFRVRQRFELPREQDVAAGVLRELHGLHLYSRVQSGQTVAITAGSRGIANIAVILRTIVQYFQGLQATPFLVPAMGSHGGGTVAGQLEVLRELGITPETMNCEIRASMETVIVDHTPQGVPVHFDRHAAGANHVFVCNRIKPHTGFVGNIESGLHKMMLIGLGKHAGASIYHRAIADYNFMDIITAVGQSVIEKCRVVGGLAIVENAADQTALLAGVAPADFFQREQELLVKAVAWLPRLPFDDCDVLIVDQIGKNISGSGMDTNVIGRKYNDHAATDRDRVRCRRIMVRGITPESHGNASGIGIAEFTNRRTVDSIDHAKTRVNCLTALHPTAAMIPLWYDTDREAIGTALTTIGLRAPEQARVMQIQDTLHLSVVRISSAYRNELAQRPDLTALEEDSPMPFDEGGNLAAMAGDGDLSWSIPHSS